MLLVYDALALPFTVCLNPVSHIFQSELFTEKVFYLLSGLSGHFPFSVSEILVAMATEKTQGESTTFHTCLDQHHGNPPVNLTTAP